jgi:hypothetical protein
MRTTPSGPVAATITALAAVALLSTALGCRPADTARPTARETSPPPSTTDGSPGPTTLPRSGHRLGGTGVPHGAPGVRRAALAPTATFVITYVGVPTGARPAIQKAVDLWSTMVTSTVPIRLRVEWTALPDGQLAFGGYDHTVRNFTGAPKQQTWYPIPLANALAHRDLDPTGGDLFATISSAIPWYLGTDGATPTTRTDLTTTVLHEIGHGLGIESDTFVYEGIGSWSNNLALPTVFDRLVQTSAGTPIITLPNYSEPLGTLLQGNEIAWGGGQGRTANGGARPKLWAPAAFGGRDSIGHLDEFAFPIGDPDSLMTPVTDQGESVHDPGDITLGILRDLGWTTVGARPVPAATAPFRSPLELVRQQFLDFHGYDTYRSNLLAWRDRYLAGQAAAQVTAGIAQLPGSIDLSGQVTRLYLAYFRRLPDRGGYEHWLAARRNETPLATISDAFARSSEFTRTYGSLTDPAFVDLVYRNVLGRAPDAAGRAYWTGKLTAGTTRGTVLTKFSESSENVRKKASTVGSVLVRASMLRRMPTAPELTTDAALLDGPGDLVDLVARVRALAEYRARFA